MDNPDAKSKFRFRFFSIVVCSIFILIILIFSVLPKIADKSINRVFLNPPYEVETPISEIHNQLRIVDLHADTFLWDRNLLKRNNRGHIDLPRLLEGNVALQGYGATTSLPFNGSFGETFPSQGILDLPGVLSFIQLWPPKSWYNATERALYQAYKLDNLSKESQGQVFVIKTKSDLIKFLKLYQTNNSITAGFLGLEGGHGLNGKLENLEKLYQAGYRVLGVVHLFDNRLGGSSTGEEKNGLTEFGKQVISSAQDKQMIIDLAHASEKLLEDILEQTDAPVFISHTGVYEKCKKDRNLKDNQLEMIKAKRNDFLIGIGIWADAICIDDNLQDPLQIFVDSIKHTIKIVGIEHVSLGSDFDGAEEAVVDSSGMTKLTEALYENNFDKHEIQLIMGENALNFLEHNLPD